MSLFLAFVLKHWKWLLFVAIVGAAFAYGEVHGYGRGKDAGERAVRAAEVKAANDRADAAEEREKAIQAQADRYRTRAESQAAIATQYQEALLDENRKADKLADDLRTGDVRLRKLWASCQVSAPGQATPGGPEPDDEADDRAASASRIVRAAAACDAQVTSLQNILREERTIR